MPEDTFLNSIRNAFILFIAGLAIFEFGGRISKLATVIFVLVGLLIIGSLYNYWNNPDRANNLGIVPLTVVLILGIVIWLIYESWVNPQ